MALTERWIFICRSGQPRYRACVSHEEFSGRIISAAMEVKGSNWLSPPRFVMSSPSTSLRTGFVETSLIPDLCYVITTSGFTLYEPEALSSLYRCDKSPLAADLGAPGGNQSRIRFQVSMQKAHPLRTLSVMYAMRLPGNPS